jgi:hypothetical protein
MLINFNTNSSVWTTSDVSIIGNSIRLRFDFDNPNRIESYSNSIRFRFSKFCTLINFFHTFSRLLITSIFCTTVLFMLAIVLKYYVNFR